MSATTAITTRATYEDLQCAGLILACQHRTDRYGDPLYTAEFIQWAKAIFSAFAKAAWEIARRAQQTLKGAWARLKAAGLRALDAIRTLVIPEGVTGSALRRGRMEGRDTCEVQQIKVRGTGAFKARTMDRVNRVQITLPAVKREAKAISQFLSPTGAVQATLYATGAKVTAVAGVAHNWATATFARVSEAKAYVARFTGSGRWTA